MLKQIHERPEQLQELAQKYLIRPLTATELQHVIAIEWPESRKIQPIYEAESIFESCSNLLTHPRRQKDFRHDSVNGHKGTSANSQI